MLKRFVVRRRPLTAYEREGVDAFPGAPGNSAELAEQHVIALRNVVWAVVEVRQHEVVVLQQNERNLSHVV